MVSTEERQEEKKRVAEPEGTRAGEACDDITDPIRRGLCKVCGMPVLGAAPFCQEHEPPVP